MNLSDLVSNYIDVVAIVLFGIGFSLLLFNKNLIKKSHISKFQTPKALQLALPR